MFWRIKKLGSGMYSGCYEEWNDSILYKSKESANKFLEYMIKEHGFRRTRGCNDEIEIIGDMRRTALRIEEFYLDTYVIVE